MKISNAQHSSGQTISHKNLRSRFGTAFVAGCLALSVCPAIAFAAPGDQGAPQDNQANQFGNPPAAMQQFDANSNAGTAPQQGPAPDMQDNAPSDLPNGQEPPTFSNGGNQAQTSNAPQTQAPDGQQEQQGQTPGNQPGPGDQPRTGAMDDQVRQILAETYGISLPSAGGQTGAFQPGDPADAPELPEGAVNVQQVIDTARDVLDKYKSEDLSTKLDDADFVAALKAYALSATEQRLAMFASNPRPTMDAPSDLPSNEGTAPDDESGAAGEHADGSNEVSGSVMSSIVKLIMEVFDYVAE